MANFYLCKVRIYVHNVCMFVKSTSIECRMPARYKVVSSEDDAISAARRTPSHSPTSINLRNSLEP